MRSKLFFAILTCFAFLAVLPAQAQTRYQDSLFASYTITTVTYSTVFNLAMDIYQPSGDAVTSRPVVVLAHGGTFISGDKGSDTTVDRLCRDLAHKGYVTVSIDYRLGSVSQMLDTLGAATEVFKSISDAKAAIRYPHEYASTYGIDTSKIYLGGNSAGAVLGMHYAYVDNLSKVNPYHFFVSAVDTIGGTLEGNSGNDGYSSNIAGVVSLAGGLNQTSWLTQCGKPVVFAQGSEDPIVPYTCAEPFVFGVAHVPLQLCGLGSLAPFVTQNTPYSEMLVFNGAQHVPWDTNAAMYYQVDTLVTGFLYKEVTGLAPTVCSGAPYTSIANISGAEIRLFPNPASTQINIQSSQFISSITMIDETGRTVIQSGDIRSLNYTVNTARLAAGIYFVNIYCGQGMPVVRKVTVQ